MDGDTEDVIEYTPCFCGLDVSPVVFLTRSRLTSTDVVAVTVTTSKRLVPNTSLPRLGALDTKTKLKLPSPLAPTTLPIPRKRMNKILHAEREVYMKKLRKERENRSKLESWAAVRIQALFRGHRARPKAISASEERRSRLSILAMIRKELSDMQQNLPEYASSKSEPWRQDISHRAFGKREAKHRKDMLSHAATVIQACVKRFLARVAFIHLVARHVDEMVKWSSIVIQAAYRGYFVRKRIAAQLSLLQEVSIIKIQSLVRGLSGRERAVLLRLERISSTRETTNAPIEAATTIQRLIRGRNGRKSVAQLRYGRSMLHLQKISDGHLDERKSIVHSQSLMLVDEGILRFESTPKVRPPLNMNATLFHKEEAAIRLQAFTRGTQTRLRQKGIRNQSRSVSFDVHTSNDLLKDVHRAERKLQAGRAKSVAAFTKVQPVDTENIASAMNASRRKSRYEPESIFPQEGNEFRMYTEQHKSASSRRRTTAFEHHRSNIKITSDTIDEGGDAAHAATRIQAIARGSIVRRGKSLHQRKHSNGNASPKQDPL